MENGDANYFRKMYEVYTPEDAAYDFDNKYDWLQKTGFLKRRDRATYIRERPEEVRKKAMSNGNTQPGDGPRFCGRGIIHLTWRNNYRDYGRFRGEDFTKDPNPQRVQSEANIAADSAGYFWAARSMNRMADKGSSNDDVKACFRLVGGADGLIERQQFFRYCYFILNDAPAMPSDRDLVRQIEGIE